MEQSTCRLEKCLSSRKVSNTSPMLSVRSNCCSSNRGGCSIPAVKAATVPPKMMFGFEEPSMSTSGHELLHCVVLCRARFEEGHPMMFMVVETFRKQPVPQTRKAVLLIFAAASDRSASPR